MKFQILPQIKQFKNDQPNHSNPSQHLIGEEVERTVLPEHDALYNELYFTNFYSLGQRRFFDCICFHSLLMHDVNGVCNHPHCQFKCKQERGQFAVKIRKTSLVDWKKVEQNIKERFGSYA